MKKTLEHARINKVSPATIELLIHERNKGKSLRQLGQMFGISHEKVRQILAKHSPSRVTLLAENTVAAKLGYPITWLIKLRKEGVINPTKPGGNWLYSEEQVRQIPSLIAETRRCDRCGEPRPLGYHRFCRECSQYRKKHRYSSLSPEEKAEYREKSLAWRKANPEKWKMISSRAQRR
jgi:transcriptional regulator with XRE-family HTH domain